MKQRARIERACPGCGEMYRIPENTICVYCQKQLAWAKAEQERQSKLENTTVYRVPRNIPYFPNHGYSTSWILNESYKAVAGRFGAALTVMIDHFKIAGEIEKVQSPERLFPHTKDDNSSWFYAEHVRMTPALAEAISAADKAAREMAEVAFESGKQSGKQLLYQIANGELTVEELKNK